MTEPKRWKIEGATPATKALIEDILTDDVMRSIEREAADEAGRRMLYGTAETPEQATGRMFREALAWASSLDPVVTDPIAVHGEQPVAVEQPGCACGHDHDLHMLAGCMSKVGGGYFCPCMAYEQPRRDHWMKRLFLRGRR